ncbi:hypothetical protein [Paenibacillus sp. HJGM_3]|uniref:hypothetical protein n=1 Tax=Paenibacillus sp. HJGM_3 TaxID=3379816 RepID=UPI00385F4DD8
MKQALTSCDLMGMPHGTKVIVTSHSHKPVIGIINQKESWIGGFDGDIDNYLWKFKDLDNPRYTIQVYRCKQNIERKSYQYQTLEQMMNEIGI